MGGGPCHVPCSPFPQAAFVAVGAPRGGGGGGAATTPRRVHSRARAHTHTHTRIHTPPRIPPPPPPSQRDPLRGRCGRGAGEGDAEGPSRAGGGGGSRRPRLMLGPRGSSRVPPAAMGARPGRRALGLAAWALLLALAAPPGTAAAHQPAGGGAAAAAAAAGGRGGGGGAGECPGHGRGKGANCSELNVREPDARICDESSCKYGGVCKEDEDGLKCACQFQCHTNYVPVCGSNGDTYQNECFLRRASCKHQKEITVVARGPCYSDNGSGSGEGEEDGSGTEVHRKLSKCGVCKYKAECDEDAENVGCVCNIDCSGYSFNPVCASDGSSYNNPCFVREASCLRQEQIDIRYLGHCTDTDDTSLLGKKDDGVQFRPDVKDASDQREDIYNGNHIPCPETFNSYCIHGKCEFIYSTQKASCRCESGYTGQHCEKTDFSILYVVPSRQKLTHVLIAAIIGAVQIAIIVAIVMCITRKCPKNNRGRRQKQNLGHFTSDTSSRMV
ncbi:tomoregulin-1 [Tachyglossus aculeatus]|uniref:tomoregulin-1 n=1 Tax=Tachyglossus aculeatus TaxID=9261 RepID=UPI0018F42076|nr:tomoregulin-1 [Tachyglossus aculeatus]